MVDSLWAELPEVVRRAAAQPSRLALARLAEHGLCRAQGLDGENGVAR